MTVPFQTESVKKTKRRAAFKMLVFLLLLMAVFGAIPYITGVRVTISRDGIWIPYFLLMQILNIAIFVAMFHLKRGKFTSPDGVYSDGFIFVVLIIASLMLPAMVVFGGTPALLHYFTRAPGGIEVTVAEKTRKRGFSIHNFSRFTRNCSPRLVIEEFTFFLNDDVCPREEFYQRVEVGAKIWLEGYVSPYGVEYDRPRMRVSGPSPES